MDELYNKRMTELKKKYNFVYLDSVEKFQKNFKYVLIFVLIAFLPALYIVVNPNIAPLHSDDSTFLETILVSSFLVIGVFFILYLHELIHLITYPKGWRNKYIVHKKPMMYAVYDGFVSKKRCLFSLISPLLFITCALTFLMLKFNINLSLIITFFLVDFVASLQDIYVFYDVIKKAPKDSYFYGAMVTTDVSKEDYKRFLQKQNT